MTFTGKISAVDLGVFGVDTVKFIGHMNDRRCVITILSAGIGDILTGQFGLGKDEVEIQIGDGGDL
ncbi:MAG: hypothetical protein WBK67_00560 [Minisyncoccales bacterium]